MVSRRQWVLQFSANAKPGLYLIVTLVLTWIFEFAAVALGDRLSDWGVLLVASPALLVPPLVAIALVYGKHGPAFQRDYWQRVVGIRRIPPVWYAVILLYFPLKSCLAALFDWLQGGSGIAPETLTRFLERPLMVVPTVIFWFLFGPLPEELGWRGYALDGLQARYNALVSSLIVGIVWSLWHLPLFLIPGTWQADTLGFATPAFWRFMLALVVESPLYAWIYNNCDRATLAPILFHFVGNSFGELFALSPRAEAYNFTLSIVTVIFVAIAWKPATLTREKYIAQPVVRNGESRH